MKGDYHFNTTSHIIDAKSYWVCGFYFYILDAIIIGLSGLDHLQQNLDACEEGPLDSCKYYVVAR